MKKLLAILVFVMAALAVNAQRTSLKTTDLPKAITSNIARDYAGYTIRDASKVSANSIITFEVAITKGMDQETLLFDKDGKFLKKVVKQEGSTGKTSMANHKKAPVRHPVKK